MTITVVIRRTSDVELSRVGIFCSNCVCCHTLIFSLRGQLTMRMEMVMMVKKEMLSKMKKGDAGDDEEGDAVEDEH